MQSDNDGVEPHAFLSYVREDAQSVDRIQRILEAAGVRVWRDTEDLWPGEDWRLRIREAIQRNSLVFIAFFSAASAGRTTSYQNEELNLAVEQLRLRKPDQPWLLPVRLDETPLPAFEIAPGRGLDSLQYVDLFGDRSEAGTGKLLAGVLRILESFRTSGDAASARSRQSTAAFVKSTIHDESRRIALDDFVMGKANGAATALLDEGEFPTSSPELVEGYAGYRFLLKQADRYWQKIDPVIEILVVAGMWSRPETNGLWTRAVARIANTAMAPRGGKTALLSLRRYPVLPLLYAGGLAAVHRRNYETLRAIAWDAQVRQERGAPQPVVGTAHVRRPFADAELTAQFLAFRSSGDEVDESLYEQLRTRRKGGRFTPVSDHLHDSLRDYLVDAIPDDLEYTETFDRLEVLLGALAIDAARRAGEQNVYLDGAWYGSFTWRNRFSAVRLEEQILEEAQVAGAGWEPVRAGLFGGSEERAALALEQFAEEAGGARGRRI